MNEEAEPIRVGPSWVTCSKCGEEYNTSSIHQCPKPQPQRSDKRRDDSQCPLCRKSPCVCSEKWTEEKLEQLADAIDREQPPATDDTCLDCDQKLSGDEWLDCEVHGRCHSQGQPATDDKQECRVTVVKNEPFTGWRVAIDGKTISGNLFMADAENLAKAIKAALAAERETSRLWRVRAKENFDIANELNQQLLQAQSAIAEAIHELRNMTETKAYLALLKLQSVDLSALERHDKEVEQRVLAKVCHMISERNEREMNHDAEVRKPLVTLLEAVQVWDDAGNQRLLAPILRKRMDELLSKIKSDVKTDRASDDFKTKA